VGDGDLLLGGDTGLLRGLSGAGFGDRGDLSDASGLGASEVRQVRPVVRDVLDLEGVEVEALAGERGLRLLGHPLREGGAVTDDLLHRHRADDRAERARENLLRERLDRLLLREEPLARGADLVLVAADLHDRDAVEVELDALSGHGATDRDGDAAAGQVEDVEALDERHDERAAAHDDPLSGQVLGHDPGAVRRASLPRAPVMMKASLGPATCSA